MARVDEAWSYSTEIVRALLGSTVKVDEIAVYFRSMETLFSFATDCVRDGWMMFNQSDDIVYTRPLISKYEVRYWFLSHPDFPYRLELMCVGEGHSPYHELLKFTASSPVTEVAHASFKVADEAAYANAVRVFFDAGYDVLQHCESSYGRFSYLSRQGLAVPIKPRLNTKREAF